MKICDKTGVWSQRSCGMVGCESMVAGYAYADEMARVAFSLPERILVRFVKRSLAGWYSFVNITRLPGGRCQVWTVLTKLWQGSQSTARHLAGLCLVHWMGTIPPLQLGGNGYRP